MGYERLSEQKYHKIATSDWAQQIDENFQVLWEDRPSIRVYKSTATTLANATNTTLTFNKKRWATHSWSAGNYIEAPISGLYYVYAHIDFAASTVGVRQVSIGDFYESQKPDDLGYCTISLGGVQFLENGERVQCKAYQNREFSLDINPGGPLTFHKQDFGITYLGASTYVL